MERFVVMRFCQKEKPLQTIKNSFLPLSKYYIQKENVINTRFSFHQNIKRIENLHIKIRILTSDANNFQICNISSAIPLNVLAMFHFYIYRRSKLQFEYHVSLTFTRCLFFSAQGY